MGPMGYEVISPEQNVLYTKYVLYIQTRPFLRKSGHLFLIHSSAHNSFETTATCPILHEYDEKTCGMMCVKYKDARTKSDREAHF